MDQFADAIVSIQLVHRHLLATVGVLAGDHPIGVEHTIVHMLLVTFQHDLRLATIASIVALDQQLVDQVAYVSRSRLDHIVAQIVAIHGARGRGAQPMVQASVAKEMITLSLNWFHENIGAYGTHQFIVDITAELVYIVAHRQRIPDPLGSTERENER